MENTIKSLVERSQNIEKLLEKGENTIVVQLGSHSIKMNFANQMTPIRIRNLIAYKKLNTQPVQQPSLDISQPLQELEKSLRVQGILRTEHNKRGKPRSKIELSLREYDNLNQNNYFQYINLDQEPPKLEYQKVPHHLEQEPILFDHHVFKFEKHPEFETIRPIKHGMLNLKDHTLEECINALTEILEYGFYQNLELDPNTIQSYSLILLFPDSFVPHHQKRIISIFMNYFEMKQFYVHQESPAAQFAMATSANCIVDIGFEKINVSCVEEGLVIPGTNIRKYFGGKDIDLCLAGLLNLPDKKSNMQTLQNGAFSLDLNRAGDLYGMEKLKENMVQFNLSQDFYFYQYYLNFQRQSSQDVMIQHNDALISAPYILFENEILQTIRQEDEHDESLIINTYKNKYNFDEHFEEMFQIPQTLPTSNQKEEKPYIANLRDNLENPFKMEKLHEMICFSISQISDPALKVKMANNIILVGGGAHIKGIQDELEDRLINQIHEFDSGIERVEVISTISREMPGIDLSWVGATVLAKLESIDDLWIMRSRWQSLQDEEEENEEEEGIENQFWEKKKLKSEISSRILQERIQFQW